MRLNRKQKTIRNFLCILLLLFTWWVLTGMQPFTVSQALRWEAQERGLKERPQILYRAGDHTVFTADGQAGLAETERSIFFAFASIRDIKPCETVVLFAEEELSVVDVYTYTEIPGAVTAECTVTLHGVINNKPWDGVYSMTAEAAENGVFAFKMERKGVRHEEAAFWEFCNMVRWGTGDKDSRHAVSVTFRDGSGNILETYEEVFERT